MDIDQILQRHIRILRAVDELEQLVAGERPERIDGLAERRWTFTRDMFLHCSRMEARIYAPMAADVRSDAQARARIASAEVARFVEYFRGHVETWHGFPSDARWQDYRVAIARLTRAIRKLIDSEARHVVPLLPVRPSGRPAPAPRDRYAADAWAIRARIYGEDQKPIV